MNRRLGRTAKARCTSQACTLDNLARAAMLAEQAGQHGVAELMRQAGRGGLAICFVSDRNQTVNVAELNKAHGPTLVDIGDDDYRSTGPAGWRGLHTFAGWASAVVIHGAGATAETYGEAAKAAPVLGRAVLIETESAHATIGPQSSGGAQSNWCCR